MEPCFCNYVKYMSGLSRFFSKYAAKDRASARACFLDTHFCVISMGPTELHELQTLTGVTCEKCLPHGLEIRIGNVLI